MRTARVLLSMAGLLLGALPAGRGAAAARAAPAVPVASITAVLQSGLLLRVGTGHPAAAAPFTPLFTGDRVRTPHGQRTAILLRDGAQFLLNQDTDLGIAFPILRLYRGEIFARIPHTGVFHVVVRTDAAVAAVQGTQFDIIARPPGRRSLTILTVAQGSVRLSNVHGSVLVLAGQQATANPNTAPSQPVTVPIGGIITWTSRVRLITTVALPPHFPTPRAAAQAARAARAWLVGHPRDGHAALALADALQDQGQETAARAGYGLVLALLPVGETANRVRAETGIAATSFALGDLAGADAAARRAQALDPGTLQAGLLRGDVAEARGDPAGALTIFQAVAVQHPDQPGPLVAAGVALLLQRRDDAAAASFRSAMRLHPPGWLAASALVDLSVLAEAAGDLQGALADDRRAVAADPRAAIAWIGLGTVLGQLGRYADALQPFAVAETLGAPYERATALDDSGEAHYELGQLGSELAAYRAALALNPADATAANGVGTAELALGHGAEAIAYTRLAVHLAPSLGDLQADYARALWAGHRYGEAAAVCRAALRNDPHNAALYLVLGYALEDGGRGRDAGAAYARAYTLRPPAGSAEDAATAGEIAFYAGHQDEAVADLRRATALHPAGYHAWELLGLVEERGRHFSAAIVAAKRAVALDPVDVVSLDVLVLCYEALGDDAHAAAADRAILEIDPDQPGIHAGLGLIAQRRGDLRAARDEFLAEIRIQSEPRNGGPRLATALASDWAELGLIYDQLHDPVSAAHAYAQALRYDPRHTLYLHALGEDQLAQGHAQQALASFDAAIRIDPRDAAAYYLRAEVEYQLGRVVEAERDARQAIALAPRDAASRLLLGLLLGRRGDYAGALAEYLAAAAAARGPAEEATAWAAAGNALDNLGRYGEAIPLYRRALARNPRIPLVHRELGLDLLRARRLDEARTQFLAAVAQDPRDPFAYFDLGLVDDAQGRGAQAAADLRRQIAVNAGNPTLLALDYRTLGLIYTEHRDWPGSVGAYRALVSLGAAVDQDYFNLGVAQEHTGDTAGAVTSVQKAYDLARGAGHAAVARQACQELVKLNVFCADS